MKAVPRRLLILGGGPVGAEMAQAVHRLGGEVALVEGASHVLAREPEPLGDALGAELRKDGIELYLGVHATAARRDGEDYVLVLDDGTELRGDRLLIATGRRPRTAGIGLETTGATFDAHGVQVDARLRAADRLWAIGDVTGIRLLTHVGKYQGEVVASNLLGEIREANYEAVPDVVYTDPQAAAVGATEGRFSVTVPLADVAKTATYTHAYAYLGWLPDPGLRRRAADRRLRARSRGRGVDAAGHAGRQGPGAAGRAARRDPAVPHLLRDLRGRAEGPAREIAEIKRPGDP